MARFEPFEPQPRVAVAVSGGADSMALTLLAERWVRARGGTLTALTVDHRLRRDSAGEARQVGVWLGARGIGQCILPWEGPRPTRGVAAAARAARYGLLEAWCGEHGVLHLLVAHQREDQAETLLLRLARGSGMDGLAGMAAVVEHADCRILRPLLGQPRARLVAVLRSAGQDWIEDPTNRDPAFARARLRLELPLLAEQGLTIGRLTETARRLARSRAALESVTAALLARAVEMHPAGFAWLNAAALGDAPEEVGLRALSAVITTMGGASYPPRFERLERLYRDLAAGLTRGRTLGGCQILPRRGTVLICREPSALSPNVPAPPGRSASWDGRFRLELPIEAPSGLTLGGLGSAQTAPMPADIPAAARPGMPALRLGKIVVAVPLVGWNKKDFDARWLMPDALAFRPVRSLTGAGFTVV
ncbi:MAG TPA: tRNA lysidine(34) synthetase TilS [Stellaceae bacterium]|nr:tRNA lysidine(34) synthetase TilS [Stellaceae bacterium]